MVTSDFFIGSGNLAVSRMRNASGHNYWNIVDVAVGQIPRFTESISSCEINCTKIKYTTTKLHRSPDKQIGSGVEVSFK